MTGELVVNRAGLFGSWLIPGKGVMGSCLAMIKS